MSELITERRDKVLTITLNRPEALNSLTMPMLKDLAKALRQAGSDSALRAVVLTGAGKAFCVGADLKLFVEGRKSGKLPGFQRVLEDYFHPVARLIRQIPQIVFARINGACAGAGMALALGCDLKYAVASAKFVAAFAKVGLGPDTGSSHIMTTRFGYSKAMEFFLLKDGIASSEMVQAGVINESSPDQAAMDQALDSALARIQELPAQTVALTKRALQNAAQSRSFNEALDYEARLQDFLGESADHAEGVAAFLEKRKPVFRA